MPRTGPGVNDDGAWPTGWALRLVWRWLRAVARYSLLGGIVLAGEQLRGSLKPRGNAVAVDRPRVSEPASKVGAAPSRAATKDPRDYQGLLSAMHVAQAGVIRHMINELGIAAASSVVDVGCGDGFYVEQLSHIVGATGHVAGVDLDGTLLERARRRCCELATPCSFVQAEATRLPWADDTFDVAFSALCFFDFPDPIAVLVEMQRVTRPGGLIVVIEHDSNHQALLPYPPALELALNNALRRAAHGQPGASARFYAARRLPEWMEQQGLEPVTRRSYTTDMTHPLSPSEARFVQRFLDEQQRQAAPYLEPAARALFDAWRAGHTEQASPVGPGFAASFFQFVTTGVVPPSNEDAV